MRPNRHTNKPQLVSRPIRRRPRGYDLSGGEPAALRRLTRRNELCSQPTDWYGARGEIAEISYPRVGDGAASLGMTTTGVTTMHAPDAGGPPTNAPHADVEYVVRRRAINVRVRGFHGFKRVVRREGIGGTPSRYGLLRGASVVRSTAPPVSTGTKGSCLTDFKVGLEARGFFVPT